MKKFCSLDRAYRKWCLEGYNGNPIYYRMFDIRFGEKSIGLKHNFKLLIPNLDRRIYAKSHELENVLKLAKFIYEILKAGYAIYEYVLQFGGSPICQVCSNATSTCSTKICSTNCFRDHIQN